MNKTDHEKELRNNRECGTDYLNQEADLGWEEEGGEVYTVSAAVRHVWGSGEGR